MSEESLRLDVESARKRADIAEAEARKMREALGQIVALAHGRYPDVYKVAIAAL